LSRNVSTQWCVHHTRKYSTQLVKWWPASSRRLWLPCLSTGWRDWNGCLRTMVITIYRLPVGSFTFLQCLSGTELLNLNGTPYTSLDLLGPSWNLAFGALHRSPSVGYTKPLNNYSAQL
jgi:hypothetical protein